MREMIEGDIRKPDVSWAAGIEKKRGGTSEPDETKLTVEALNQGKEAFYNSILKAKNDGEISDNQSDEVLFVTGTHLANNPQVYRPEGFYSEPKTQTLLTECLDKALAELQRLKNGDDVLHAFSNAREAFLNETTKTMSVSQTAGSLAA